MESIETTKKGAETAQDVDKVNDIVKKQLDVLFRLGMLVDLWRWIC